MSRLFFIALLALAVSCEIRPEHLQVADTSPFWRSREPVRFEMTVSDSIPVQVNVVIRNTSDYPWSRFFAALVIRDSTGQRLDSLLTQVVLFDPVTGKPNGKSGLGDLYEHDFPVIRSWRPPYDGKYTLSLTQMMRVDSLSGIISAGVRLEPVTAQSHGLPE